MDNLGKWMVRTQQDILKCLSTYVRCSRQRSTRLSRMQVEGIVGRWSVDKAGLGTEDRIPWSSLRGHGLVGGDVGRALKSPGWE